MTRAEAEARYHLMQTGTLSFSGYASNRLPPHELCLQDQLFGEE
jgi:hypothetical protein